MNTVRASYALTLNVLYDTTAGSGPSLPPITSYLVRTCARAIQFPFP